MKKLTFLPILTLLLFQLPLNAQNQKFKIGVESNIGISDRIFINDNTTPGFVEDRFSELEKVRIGYEIGVLLDYEISKKIGFQTGIRYINWGYKMDKIALFSGSPEPDPALPDCIEQRIENMYIELPLRVNYYIPVKNSKFYIQGGYSPSFNISNQTRTKSYFPNETRVTRTEDKPISYSYRRINLVGELGVGWQKRISKNLIVTGGPNFRIQTFGIVKDAPLNRKLFFYGFSIGFKLDQT